MATKLRYRTDHTGFHNQVQARVRDYFETTGKSRFGGRILATRSVVLLLAIAVLYTAMLSNVLTGPAFLLLYVPFGFCVFLVSIIISHDASHGAFVQSRRGNLWLMRVFDLIGVSSWVWDFNHVKSHHAGPNVPLSDAAIDSALVFRLHPRVGWYPWMRFQGLYIPLIYSFATIQKWFWLDFFSLFRASIGTADVPPAGVGNWVYLLVTKAFTLTWMVLIPMYLVDAPLWVWCVGFYGLHAISGLFIAVVFMTTHLSDRTVFVEPDADGNMPYSYAEHILRTTADFATDSWFWTVISGGLNHHVAHHLFPHISQVHLPALTAIVRQAAADHDLPYKAYPTAGQAWLSHLRVLNDLGRRPESGAVPVVG